MRNRKSYALQRGVSLVEIAVVVTIFGIVLAAGMPSYQRWNRDMQVRTSIESMLTGLKKAKAAALRQNRNVTFWLVNSSDNALNDSCQLSDAGHAWVISVNSPEAGCGTAISETTAPMIIDKQVVVKGTAITVATSPTQAVRVTFNGLGQVVTTADDTISQLNISGDETTRNLRIEITAGGALRLCDPAVSSSQDNRKCKA